MSILVGGRQVVEDGGGVTPTPGPFNPIDYRGPLLATANPTSPTVTQRFLPLTLAPDAPSEFTLAEHMGVTNGRLVEPHFIGLGVFGTVIDLFVDGVRVDTTIIELSDVTDRTLFAPPSISGMANVRWTIAESKDRDGDYITIQEVGSNSFTGNVEFRIYEAVVSGVIRETTTIETPAAFAIQRPTGNVPDTVSITFYGDLGLETETDDVSVEITDTVLIDGGSRKILTAYWEFTDTQDHVPVQLDFQLRYSGVDFSNIIASTEVYLIETPTGGFVDTGAPGGRVFSTLNHTLSHRLHFGIAGAFRKYFGRTEVIFP